MYNNLISILLLTIIYDDSNVKVVADCVIDTSTLTSDKQSLILLASTREWYPLKFSQLGSINVRKSVSLLLVCPSSDKYYNWFKKFNKKHEVLAQCIDGQTFCVENRNYTLEDLKCLFSLHPTLKVTNQTCLAPNTNNNASLESNWINILVGYPTGYDFLIAYTICFDKVELGTLYSTSTVYPEIEKKVFPVEKTDWMSDNELYHDIEIDAQYKCSKQVDTFNTIFESNNAADTPICCFSKSKLVDEYELIYRPQQIATYNSVNTVPLCHKENWQEVNRRIRALSLNLERPLTVWSGVYGTIKRAPQVREKSLYIYYNGEHDKALPVPLFLWKVIFDGHTDKSIAIVTINDPHRAHLSLNELIRCPDRCHELTWINFENRNKVDYGYTYCCELESFLNAFAFSKNNFPKARAGLISF